MKKGCARKETRDIIKGYIKENASSVPDEPFYIVSLDKVEEQFNKWVEYLPNVKPYFAVKSNPDDKIIGLLAKLGCGFDCASKNELKNVLNSVEAHISQ